MQYPAICRARAASHFWHAVEFCRAKSSPPSHSRPAIKNLNSRIRGTFREFPAVFENFADPRFGY
jgi:hypothetical protein